LSCRNLRSVGAGKTLNTAGQPRFKIGTAIADRLFG
jgi:hypothetical protein